MIRRLLTLVILTTTLVLVDSHAYAQSPHEFKLGFRVLADGLAGRAGEPIEEEHYGPNGDSFQRTTTGLMVWRKADNWTAFTNGSRTWVNGPEGIRERGNEERFQWEEDLTPAGDVLKHQPTRRCTDLAPKKSPCTRRKAGII